MCLKKERHDSVIIFLFVCCTSTLGLPGPNRVCRWSPQLTLINHSIQKRNHPALQSDKLASPRDQRKAHNHRQIAFDPGVMSHSEVTMFSRCQGRFFCNLFSAVDCLSFLLHPPPPPPILAVVFIPVINVVCGVTPSRSFLPSSSLHFCVSFSLCFFFICSFLCYSGPATWAMATSKPDIMIILLSKLIEEGDSFYKVREQPASLLFIILLSIKTK